MYLSCLCDPQLQVSHLLHLTLDMFVACCKIRGWNIICIARKKIRYKSMLFFSLSLAIRWTSWLSRVQTSHRLWPGFHVVLAPQISTTDTLSRHVIFYFFIFFLNFFKILHCVTGAVRHCEQTGGKQQAAQEGRKQEGVTDLTEGVCLKCKQSGAHRGC